MGRYARLALAEREEIVLLRRGGAAAGWPERRAETKRPSARRWPETRSPLARGGAIVHRPPSVAASPEGFPACGPGSSTASEGRGLCGVLSCGSIVARRIAGGIAVERPGLMVFASAIHRAINERRLDPPGLTRARRGIRARLRHKGKRRHGRGGPEERRGEIPGAVPSGNVPRSWGNVPGSATGKATPSSAKAPGRASSRSWTAEAVCSPEDAVPRMPDATLPDVGIGALRRHPGSPDRDPGPGYGVR